MRQTGLRTLLALLLSTLALAGVDRRVPGPPSGTETCVTAGDAYGGSVAEPHHPYSRSFRDAGGVLDLPVRGASSLLFRLPLRDGGADPPALPHGFTPFHRVAAPAERAHLPAFARFLAAARDGTLSSRSTGLPPPLR